MIEKPESCKVCPLFDSIEGPVWGRGPKNAKMMFVGEAPGEEEGLSKIPFVGGSGRTLTALCIHAGVERSEVYVTNTVKCRPTAKDNRGRVVNRAPTETEIRCCAKFLVGELQTINPNVVVPLGNVPMKTLTGVTKGIMLTRSVPREGSKRSDGKAERYKIVGTIHPAAVMRQQDLWPAVVFDLARAKSESETPLIHRRPWKNIIHARLSDVGEYLRRRIHEEGCYSHDLETTGLDPRTSAIRCIGLAAESSEVFVFDWTTDVVEFTRQLHADPSLITVGQNSEGFDIPYQEAKGFTFNGPTYDTLLGFHLLNSSLPKDLGFIGACVTDELYWKDDTMYRSGEDALQVGCGKDIHATARAKEEQHIELKQLGQMDLYYNHIMPLQPVLRRMTQRGLKKDIRKAAAWSVVLTRKANELEVKLKKGLGDASFNVDSPKQLMDLLYKRMGLPVQYKKDRERGFIPTVDADALDALALVTKNPIFLLVRSIRTLRKWVSTFIECDHDDDFFVHGHFSSAKAANGRMNSFAPNMQNFPLETREILVPDDSEHVLVARDWSQIEWRVAMALSGDKVGLAALAAGRDPHKDAYAEAYLKEYDLVDKSERDIAKAVNYGLLYGRGAESVAAGRAGHPEDILPIGRVTDYIAKFLAKFKGYGRYRKVLEQQVRNQHFVETAWGRRRYWYTRQNMPEAYNHPISGTAAHMMYEALVEMEEQLPKESTIRLTVHDEIVVNAPKTQKALQGTIDCMRDVMEKQFKKVEEASLYPDVVRHYYPNGWRCPSESNMGETWRATKGKFPQDLAAEAELKRTLGVTI